MRFRQVINGDLGCASYLVGDLESGQAAVVDPRWDIAPYLEAAGSRGVRITHIIETPTTADHVSGRGRLHEATGATMHLSPLVGAQFPREPLDDGAVVDLGEMRLQALHLPGHRPEHVGLLLIDASRGPEPRAVLTGDSLFVGDVGRPGLAVDAVEGAKDRHRSIRRLMDLPDRLAADEDMLVVDVRDHREFAELCIPGSVNRPCWSFRDGPGEILTGRYLLVIYAAGRRAGLAAGALAREGREPIIHLHNCGVQTIEGLGMQMERGEAPQGLCAASTSALMTALVGSASGCHCTPERTCAPAPRWPRGLHHRSIFP